LSLYQLTIEPGTRFAALHASGKLQPLDSDLAASLYELTASRTADAGMPAYEISNHARPGQESRHNRTYWLYGDYSGVGPGAHGRRLGKRTMRHRKPENFCPARPEMATGPSKRPHSSATERADEALVVGLRLSEGSTRTPSRIASNCRSSTGRPWIVWSRAVTWREPAITSPRRGQAAWCSITFWRRLPRPAALTSARKQSALEPPPLVEPQPSVSLPRTVTHNCQPTRRYNRRSAGPRRC
jgi:hypothetical protein